MSDALDAVADEATTDPEAPILTRRMYGRRWEFGKPDMRPKVLRRYAALANRLDDADDLDGADAIELSAVAEDILRSALPRGDRQAFDDAEFDGSDIAELCRAYFDRLGASPGESVASPRSSSRTRDRSRRTSRRRTGSR